MSYPANACGGGVGVWASVDGVCELVLIRDKMMINSEEDMAPF